jgi:hypothetical protein
VISGLAPDVKLSGNIERNSIDEGEAPSEHAVVGRVHKTPPNHLPDISLSTPNRLLIISKKNGISTVFI